jgi:hypothetical protein
MQAEMISLLIGNTLSFFILFWFFRIASVVCGCAPKAPWEEAETVCNPLIFFTREVYQILPCLSTDKPYKSLEKDTEITPKITAFSRLLNKSGAARGPGRKMAAFRLWQALASVIPRQPALPLRNALICSQGSAPKPPLSPCLEGLSCGIIETEKTD